MTCRHKIIAAIAAATLAIVATSCSGKPEVLESVPATATTVVRVDLERFLTEAGCTVNDEGITLSDDLRQALDTATSARAAAADIFTRIKGLSLQTAVYFEMPDVEGGVLVLPVDDDEAVESLSKPEMKLIKDKDHGFVTFTDAERKTSVAINDNLCWMAALDPDATVALAKKARRAAKKESIADIRWKADALADDVPLRAIISIGETHTDIFGDNAYQSAYACIASGDGDSLLNIKAHIADADGNRLPPFPTPGAIDPDFIRFLSECHNVVAAIAIAEDFNWDAFLDSEGKSLPSANKIFMSSMEPHLRNIDGTIAVGLRIDFDNLSTDSLDFCVVVKMKAGGADGVIDKIREMAAESRQQLAMRDGFIRLPLENRTLRIGKIDNYLIVANHQPETATGCTVAPDLFSGKCAAMVAKGLSADKSLDFTLTSTADDSLLRITADGSAKGALPKLIKFLLAKSNGDSGLRQLFGSDDEDFADDYPKNLIEL